MSRIHEALQKARQQELGSGPGVPNIDEIISSKADLSEAAKAGDIESTALPAGMLEPVAEEKRSIGLVPNGPSGDWPRRGEKLVFCSNHVAGQEQFRTLRSRLHQMRRGNQVQVLAITSALPNDGKSFVSANLAHAFALQCERGVLVIDADMRRAGGLSGSLECPNSPGLSEYLQGEIDASEVIHSGTIPNLYAIPCGRKMDNSGELVGMPQFSALIEKLRPLFDWIIIDTPPVIPIADARAIAEFSDGVLIVVSARSTPADLAKRAVQEFRPESLLGVVLNRAFGASDAYYSAYGYSYEYGSEQQAIAPK